MRFSEEQSRIIEAERGNNLISASAGSGKTTVLTARIGKEIVENKLRVDQMLVVTFTEDAASHMAEKIEEKLRELKKIAVSSDDKSTAESISSQIDILPNAYIQTMHGFCSRVIKEKGYLLEDGPMADFTDPSCRIISGSEQEVLLKSAVQYALNSLYEKCSSDDDPFIRFTRRFGDGRTDEQLEKIVISTYLTLRSLPDYLELCDAFVREREERDAKEHVMFFEEENDIPLRIMEYLTKIKNMLESDEFRSVLDAHGKYQIVKEYSNEEFIGKITSLISQIQKDYKSHKGIDFFECLDPLLELRNVEFKTIFRNADFKGDDRAFLAMVSFARFIMEKKWTEPKYNNPYDLPKEYKTLLGYSKEQILADQRAGTEAAASFVELIKATDKAYAEIKSSMHGMDYSDLEHTAYEILKTEEAASFYRERFTEIFVDEYQDNTSLQDRIISCFERPEGNVFRVGDIKQSIYKFRFADPSIFGKRMADYESGKENGTVHYLKENHRSTCEILAFANYVFEQTMSAKASEIEYDKSQHLSGAEESRHGPVPRIIVADKSGDKNDGEDKTSQETRALLAAVESEVRRYLEECTRLDGTPTELKDICVLTSSNKQAETVARYLNGCKLKDGRSLEASGRFTTDVFEDMDIHRIINFLICIGNEYRDEYLAGVMLSNYKFSNFTIEELAQIQAFIHELDGLNIEKEPLMLRLRMFAEKSDSTLASRVRSFIDVFDKIRMNSLVSDIDEIIELIYRETNIRATIEDRTGDSTKFDVFKDWLSENFKRRGSDISGIALELEQIKIKIKKSEIEVKDANKNKISTMTVHKSKGLEFPFVILIATGGSQEQTDSVESIMFHKKLGFITENYDPENLTRKRSFEQQIYEMKMNLETNAEKIRLLYVALTRAEEQLTVVTTCDVSDTDKASPMRRAFEQAIDFEETAFDERHWLIGDMKLPYCLMSALARSADGKRLREIADCGELRPNNVIPFHDINGNVITGGFEVVDLTAERVNELYKNSAYHDAEDEGDDVTAEPDNDSAEFDPEGKLILPVYEHYDSVNVPFKVTVTGISGEGKPSDTTHVDMQISSIEDFEGAGVSILTAAAKGTILHRIMRFIDLESVRDGSVGFDDEIKALIEEGYLNICSPAAALEVAEDFREGIVAFCKNSRCEDIISSFADGTARSEKPIVFSVYIDGTEGDSALVQGMIDLIYKTEEGYVILDYKTDRLEGSTPEERAKEAFERHSFQLNSYAAACEKDGIAVAHKLLYLVRYGEFVEVKD